MLPKPCQPAQALAQPPHHAPAPRCTPTPSETQAEVVVEAPEFLTVEYLKRRVARAKLQRGEVGWWLLDGMNGWANP